jgi:hypothetical protein
MSSEDFSIIRYLGVSDHKWGMDLWIGFIDHFYTPLGNTFYSRQVITVSTSRFLATI